MSPKSCAFPVVARVTKSTLFITVGVLPPMNKPLVGDPEETTLALAAVKLPKSVAFAFDAIINKSIVSVLPEPVSPPPVRPLVSFEWPSK